jgi:hypothetical protein
MGRINATVNNLTTSQTRKSTKGGRALELPQPNIIFCAGFDEVQTKGSRGEPKELVPNQPKKLTAGRSLLVSRMQNGDMVGIIQAANRAQQILPEASYVLAPQTPRSSSTEARKQLKLGKALMFPSWLQEYILAHYSSAAIAGRKQLRGDDFRPVGQCQQRLIEELLAMRKN